MEPRVLLFTGHLIDPAERENARFPFGLVHEVERTIREELDKQLTGPPSVAISSLAAGGDMLFADEVLRRGIPLEVFLPFEKERFLAASVKYVKGIPGEDPSEWEDDFHNVLEKASSIHVLECDHELSVCYASCNDAMLRYALTKANQDAQAVLALALMKGDDGVMVGGTADFVKQMQTRRINVRTIWPS
jgi:hypothetical protein